MTKSITYLLLCLSISNFKSAAAAGLGEDCDGVEVLCDVSGSGCVDNVCRCVQNVEANGQCLPAPCGPLDDIENGNVTISFNNENEQFTAAYLCDAGHTLNGKSSLVCLGESWDGSPPTCDPITCPSIAQPVNGLFIISDEVGRLNAVVTYSCEDGYVLNGAENRTCLDTGQWSGDPPTCQPRPCPDLDSITNGNIVYTTEAAVFRTIATYTCDEGFNLVGDSTRECLATGTWNREAPTCETSDDPGQPSTSPVSTTSTTTPPPPTTTPPPPQTDVPDTSVETEAPCLLDCLNGGSCITLLNGTNTCDCLIGFSGSLCESEDFCTTQPCPSTAEGCQLLPDGGGRTCICPVGLKGAECNQDDPVVTCRDFEKQVYLELSPDVDEKSVCIPLGGTTANDICYNPGERISYTAESNADIRADLIQDNYCLQFINVNPAEPKSCIMVTAYEEDDIDLRPWINATTNVCFNLNNYPDFSSQDFHTVGFTSTEQSKLLNISVSDQDDHQNHSLSISKVVPDTLVNNFETTPEGLRIVKPVDVETPSQTVTVVLIVADNGVPPLSSTGTFAIELQTDADINCDVTPALPILFHIPNDLPAAFEELGQINCPSVEGNDGLTFATKGSVGPVRADSLGNIVYDPDMNVVAPDDGNWQVTVTAIVEQPLQLSKDYVIQIIADDFRPSCEPQETVFFNENSPIDTCSTDKQFVCSERANVNETCEDDSQLFDVSCEPGTTLGITRVKLCVAQTLVNSVGSYQVSINVINSYGSTLANVQVIVQDVNNPPDILFDQRSLQVAEGLAAGYEVVFVTVLDPDVTQQSSDEILSAVLTDNNNEQVQIPFTATVTQDQNGVAITTTEQLDIRVVQFYQLRLTVRDTAETSDSVVMAITVTDVNEAPTCTSTSVTATASVRSSIGDTVIALQCNDLDVDPDYKNLSYSIHGTDLFIVDSQGVVKVASSLAGLTDSDMILTFDVVVRDGGGLSENITVEVTINNSFPPVCKDLPYRKSVSEEMRQNVCFDVGANCVDEVNNSTLVYSVEPASNGSKFFRIGTETSETNNLQLCTEADLKHQYGTYIINLKVTSPFGDTLIAITLIVNNVNDPPSFSQPNYTKDIGEDIAVGTEIISISADDPDSGPFGQVSYFSKDIDLNYFKLDPDIGTISLAQSLDADDSSLPKKFEFKLQAIDGAPTPFTANTMVIFNVVDVNDNQPLCGSSTVEVTVQLTDPVDTSVYSLTCTDNDLSTQYNQIGYRLRDTKQVFSVSSDGKVTLSAELSRDVTSYTLVVEAYDINRPNDPDFITVVVIIVDVNTVIPPVCDPPNIVQTLLESRPKNYCIDVEIICRDTTGGEVLLIKETGTGSDILEIRLNQGKSQLGLNACIKNSIVNQFGTYQLLAEVSNGLATTTVTWTFTVENVNDPPYFLKNLYETTINEDINTDPVPSIMNVTVEDNDEDYDEERFKIKSLTATLINNADFSGQLSTVILFLGPSRSFYAIKALNSTVRNLYKYNLSVVDGEGYSDTATALIHVRDVNSAPICPESTAKAEIDILATVGDEAAKIFCYDTDIDVLNKRLQYRKTGGDPDGYFNITDEGKVIVIKKFPRLPLYDKASADLKIEVSDYGSPSFTVPVNLFITVNYRIPPDCNPVVTPPDIWVIDRIVTIRMDCKDPTFPGQNDHLAYGKSGNFTTGFILTDRGNGILDLKYTRTENGTYEINVRVDNGLMARVYTEVIEVQYLAAIPVFDSSGYKEEIPEILAPGSLIVTVLAVSAQPVGDIEYNVIEGLSDGAPDGFDWRTFFSLDRSSGEIKSRISLRDLANQLINLRVEAEDTGSKLRSVTRVEINVVDQNEAPVCKVSTNLDLDVTASVGTEVVSFSCSDPDVKPEYKSITYTLAGTTGNTVQGVFKLSPEGEPAAIVTANELSVRVGEYTFQLSVTDGGKPALKYTQNFTVVVSLLPPKLKVELLQKTYESIMVQWNYDRADFYSVTNNYQIILSTGQGAVIESPVQGAAIRQYNMTGLNADTTYSLVVKAITQHGDRESAPLSIRTPEVPILDSFVSTIRVLSEDFDRLHRDKDSQLHFGLNKRIVETFDSLLGQTPGYVGSHLKGFRPSNSILVDMITYVNLVQAGSVDPTIATLKALVQSGHLEDFNVDSSYFVVSQGDGYIMIEDISHDPVDIFNGSDVTVTCTILTVGYSPAAEFSFLWTYNGSILQPTSQSRFTVSNETDRDIFENKKSFLRISPVLNSNAGVYGCIAADMDLVQVATRDIALRVLSQPVVTLTPRSQTVNQGDPVSLVCLLVTDDSTFTQFVWYKDGQLLQANEVTVTQGNRNETLTIPSIQATAVYACEGTGPAGTGARVTSYIGVIPAGPSGNVFCEITTERQNDYIIRWPMTAAGTVAIEMCSTGFLGEITRECDSTGTWQASYHNCRKETLQQISNDVTAIQDGSGTKNLSVAISELAEETGRSLLDGDLTVALDTMDTVLVIVEDPDYDSPMTENESLDDTSNYVRVASNLIAESTFDPWQYRLAQNLEGAIAIPRNLEGFIKSRINTMIPTGENFKTFTETNVYAEVGKGERNVYVFPDTTQSGTPNWVKEMGTNIRIPSEAVKEYVSDGYSSSFYRNIQSVLSTRYMKDGKLDTTERHIVADTVTFQVIGDIGTLSSPAVITYQHIQSTVNYSDPLCCSWDFSMDAYVTDGCELMSTSEDKTVCSCNHFTNFALLMSPGKTPAAHIKALSIISAVGCALSIVCLLLTVISYLIVWRLVKSDRAILLINLCVALIIAYIVFLAGVGRAENENICTAVSLMLHFFYLVVFFLMLAYGIEIAVTVIYVFVTRSRIKWLLPLAWGIPLVIVAISAGVTQLDGYGNESFCWLSIEDGLIWAFIGPAAAVILFNFLIVIAVFRKMFKSSAMLTKTDKERAKAGVRSICVLLPILGLTWVFGVFSVNEDLVVFQYIFAVCNTLQGLFIFLFHCVFNSQLKDAFKQRKARKKSVASFDKSFKNHHSATSGTAFYSDNPSKQNNDSGFATESTNPFLEADRQVKEMVAKGKKGAYIYDNPIKKEENNKPSSTAVDLEDVKISNILRESEVMGGTTGISSILQTQSTSMPDTRKITDEEKDKGGMRSSVMSHKYDYIDAPNIAQPKYDNTDSTVYIRAETEKPSAFDQPYTQRLVTSADNIRPYSQGVKNRGSDNLTDKQKGKLFSSKPKSKDGSGDRKGASKSQLSKSSKSSRSDDDYEFYRSLERLRGDGQAAGSTQNISSISTALPTITYDQYQAMTKKAEAPKKQKESSLKKKDKKKQKDRSKAYEYPFETTYMGESSRHASLENMNMQHYSPYNPMPGMGGGYSSTGRPTHQQQHWDQYRYQQQPRQQPRQQPYYRGDYW